MRDMEGRLKESWFTFSEPVVRQAPSSHFAEETLQPECTDPASFFAKNH